MCKNVFRAISQLKTNTKVTGSKYRLIPVAYALKETRSKHQILRTAQVALTKATETEPKTQALDN